MKRPDRANGRPAFPDHVPVHHSICSDVSARKRACAKAKSFEDDRVQMRAIDLGQKELRVDKFACGGAERGADFLNKGGNEVGVLEGVDDGPKSDREGVCIEPKVRGQLRMNDCYLGWSHSRVHDR